MYSFPSIWDKGIRQAVFAVYDVKKDSWFFSWFYQKSQTTYQKYAPCEDQTHDLQISEPDYETDALPTALTRHL